ncbi:MAG: DUF1499 domain-containing protein [Pseudomonadales bacterium]|jgi:uncharacterized protein (DUF1499 family)|nr:DUF1499 domain-containing protein [Pseudomonadales bacterium]MDP6470818.1 DUF1499 domain-containing protein [Pseudomonadales bacterium]MDP6825997.1 DUF1499 domain-containing protein [Pseudomonadales bacterium]MDP6972309.1 DUF1499 domain-containing protein [Pseudomonadales bacterium]|tara:strand:- start:6185 stop:6919 length:735 start_codon:yes stop_codon:yes gene_type:complete
MTTWWSKSVCCAAVAAIVILPVSALGYRFDLWSLQLGFLGLAIASGLAGLALIGGFIALVVVVRKKADGERNPILAGMVISVIVVFLMGRQFLAASAVPPIHNISTDIRNPPGIVQLKAVRGNAANPWEYDAAAFAEQQHGAYPDIQSLPLNRSPATVLTEVVEVLEAMGLEVVATHPEMGLVEATDTTFWFGFKDDVSVRVSDQGGSGERALVDVHSVSRVGQSDLGVNARRIGEILKRLADG